MSEISLKSNEFAVDNHKTKLTGSANDINNISSVGAGSTNHDVNSSCTGLYESIKSLFQNYSSSSVLDIENIKKIDDELHEADTEMAGEML